MFLQLRDGRRSRVGAGCSPTGGRTSSRLAAIALLIAAVGTLAAAEAPDLSGTWKLDESASSVDPAATLGGLGGHKVTPMTLYVTHARNGTLVIGSDMNTSHARNYRPGGESTAPLGKGGEVTMRSRWDGTTLVSEGQDPTSKTSVREALTMSADGSTLTVSITVTSDEAKSSSTLVYLRSMLESPCKQWPTPCKDWPAP